MCICHCLLVVLLFETVSTQRALFLVAILFFSSLYVFSLCSSCCLLFCRFPHRCTEKGETLKARLFNSASFNSASPTQPPHPPPCYTIFILPHHVTQPNPPLSMPRPACVPRPCLSCSRFSFCWRVLIGLKWVTSSITQSFKPSLNVSVSWGSEGALWGCLPPRQPSRSEEKPQGLMGWQRFGPEENPRDYVSTHYNVHKDRRISRSTNGAVKSNRVGRGILRFHPDID